MRIDDDLDLLLFYFFFFHNFFFSFGAFSYLAMNKREPCLHQVKIVYTSIFYIIGE